METSLIENLKVGDTVKYLCTKYNGLAWQGAIAEVIEIKSDKSVRFQRIDNKIVDRIFPAKIRYKVVRVCNSCKDHQCLTLI